MLLHKKRFNFKCLPPLSSTHVLHTVACFSGVFIAGEDSIEVNGIAVLVYIFKHTSIWSPGGPHAMRKHNQLNEVGAIQNYLCRSRLRSPNALAFSSIFVKRTICSTECGRCEYSTMCSALHTCTSKPSTYTYFNLWLEI